MATVKDTGVKIRIREFFPFLNKETIDLGVLIRFDFTNESDAPLTFTQACHTSVYQNGLPCTRDHYIPCPYHDTGSSLRAVMPGTTATVDMLYEFPHFPSSPCELEVVAIPHSGSGEYLRETIIINNLEKELRT